MLIEGAIVLIGGVVMLIKGAMMIMLIGGVVMLIEGTIILIGGVHGHVQMRYLPHLRHMEVSCSSIWWSLLEVWHYSAQYQ